MYDIPLSAGDLRFPRHGLVRVDDEGRCGVGDWHRRNRGDAAQLSRAMRGRGVGAVVDLAGVPDGERVRWRAGEDMQ